MNKVLLGVGLVILAAYLYQRGGWPFRGATAPPMSTGGGGVLDTTLGAPMHTSCAGLTR